jgi:heptosyltransferase-2
MPPSTLARLPNWLGDIVMALPAWHALRAWPAAGRTTVAVPASLAPVAAMIEGVDEVLPLAAAGKAWGAAFDGDVAKVRAGRFDRVVLFTNSFGSAWMMSRAGVPERWGYRAEGRRLLLTRSVGRRGVARAGRGVPSGARDAQGAPFHHARYYLRLVRALGIPVAGEPLDGHARLVPGLRAAQGADALLSQHGITPGQTLVGFAPGAAFGSAKRWPPDHVARVARSLTAEGVTCLLLGAPADRDTGAAIESAFGAQAGGGTGAARLVDLIGQTDVATLAAVLARCRVAVSNDSGAMHVAAAVGTHVVVPFGPTDERATAPLGPHTVLTARVFCRPCHLRSCPIDHRCMRRIGADRVLAEVKAVLAAGRITT